MRKVDAIVWAADALVSAVRAGHTDIATHRLTQLGLVLLYTDFSHTGGWCWLNVQAGSPEYNADDLPF
jgi:hypothetical protein